MSLQRKLEAETVDVAVFGALLVGAVLGFLGGLALAWVIL
jgi:hypothetical protein